MPGTRGLPARGAPMSDANDRHLDPEMPPVVTDSLERSVLGRDASVFGCDYERGRAAIETAVAGRRLLVAGGAGSIGAMVTELLCAFRPAALHVLDVDENRLAELVRDLRSRELPPGDFRALPIDYGGPIAERFLRDSRRYDVVLNFAAVKHVRSEKDLYSV